MFQDSHRMVFTFRNWLYLIGIVLAFWIFILNILKITSKLLTQGYRYHMLRKHLESSLGTSPSFCPNMVKCRFKNMFLKESLTRSSTVI